MLAWGHPVVAALAIVLAVLVFRDGYAQRKQRLRGIAAPPGSRARHVRFAPLSALAIVSVGIGGLVSSVLFRDWKPLRTVHGWLGVTTSVLFVVMYLLGRPLVAGQREGAARHGVLGVIALLAAVMTGVLGISLLP